MIVTDYQFISVELSINDNSAARVWWRHHIYPDVNEKYFQYWKRFLIKKIIRENIETIYNSFSELVVCKNLQIDFYFIFIFQMLTF